MKGHLLVSDYDGTFYTGNDKITLNIEAIREFRENGGIFLLNTGRSFSSIKGEIRKFKIEYDYLGCLDGLTTFDKYNTAIDFKELDESNDDLIEELRKFRFNSFQVNYLKDVYSPIVEKCFSIEESKRKKLDDKLSKLLSDKYPKLDVLVYFDIFQNAFIYFIRNRGVSKNNSIEAVLRYEKIDTKNIFTIGDALNDLEMIRDYNGFMMKDSNYELSRYALGSYDGVYELVDDIQKGKVLRR